MTKAILFVEPCRLYFEKAVYFDARLYFSMFSSKMHVFFNLCLSIMGLLSLMEVIPY